MKILENIKKNTFIIVIVTIIVLYFLLKDNFSDIVDSISHMKVIFVIIAILLFVLFVCIKGYVNYLIIGDKEKISKKEAIKQNFICLFFNGITPFQTGGEPIAVYMLMEKGIPFAKATNYMVQSFIFYQVPLVLCGLIAVIYNFCFHIFPKVKFLQHLVFIGFCINIVVVILLLFSYSKKLTELMSKTAIRINKTLKLKMTDDDIRTKFTEYHKGFEELKKKKSQMFIGMSLNLIGLICLYLVPYFIICGIGEGNSITIMETLVSSAYVYLIGAFVPVPGASGGIEYGFSKFFGNFITAGSLSAVIIIWRFITYYCGIILGAIMFNIREKVK